MKKLNYITILGLATGLAFAWNAAADEEYIGIGTEREYDNHDLGRKVNAAWTDGNDQIGGVKTLFTAVTDNTALSLAVVRNNTDSQFTFGKNGFEYGTYTYQFDANGNMTGINYSKLGSVGYQQTSTEAVTTGAFNSGDMVGVYIYDPSTKQALYSDMRYWDGVLHDYKWDNAAIHSDTYSAEYYGARTWENEKADPSGVYSVFFDTWNYQNPNAQPGRQYTSPSDAAIRIQVTAASTGSPLPGVWATIALAGAASAYLKRRRKENK